MLSRFFLSTSFFFPSSFLLFFDKEKKFNFSFFYSHSSEIVKMVQEEQFKHLSLLQTSRRSK